MPKKTLNQQKKSSKIADIVMEKIAVGAVTMKPKWYFVVGSLFSLIGVIGAGIGALFLINLSFFLFRQHGPRGEWRLQLMITSFPWWIPILAVVVLLVGVTALKRYDFSYRKNFTAIVLTIVMALAVSAYVIDATGINNTWFGQGPMRKLYQYNQVPQTENDQTGGSGLRGRGRHDGSGMGRKDNGMQW